MTTPNPPELDLKMPFVELDLDALVVNIATSGDGERQYLVCHDGKSGFVIPVKEFFDVERFALRVESTKWKVHR